MNKRLSMLIVIVFLIFVFGIRVKALELVEEPINEVWYFRKGNGIASFSAQFKYYTIDGKTTYCIEPGEHIKTHNYIDNNAINLPFSNEINNSIKLIGYYGYDYPGHNTLKYRMATQALIWESINGQTVEYWTKPSGAGTFISIKNEKNEIMNLVNNHKDLPSFKNKKLTGYLNSETIFTDTLGNLSDFMVVDSEDFNYRIEDNNLIIIPLRFGLIEVNLKRKSYTDNMTTYFVGIDDKTQTMAYFGLNEEDLFKVYVNSKGGTITLNKIDSDNLTNIPRGDATLKGAEYQILDQDGIEVDRLIINDDGIAKTKELPLGSYTIKEINPSLGYTLDSNSYKITISKTNLNPSKKVEEKVITSQLEIYKVLNDKESGILTPEKEIEFEIYLKRTNEVIDTIKTDENGYATINLPYGKYIVIQKNTTEGYEVSDPFEIDVTSDITIKKVIADGIIKGAFELTKLEKDTDNPLPDVSFELYNDNNELISKMKTDSNGKIYIDNLTIGKYMYYETKTLDNYLLDDTKHYFEINDKEVVKNIVYNEKVVEEEIVFEEEEDIIEEEIIDVPITYVNDKEYKYMYSTLFILTGLINIYGIKKYI